MQTLLFVLYLTLACANGSYLQSGSFVTQAKKNFGNVNCGTFLSECWDQHKVHVVLKGYIDNLPREIEVEHLNFGDDRCENGELYHVRIEGEVNPQFYGNKTHIYGDVLYHNSYVTFYRADFISGWNCDSPIELNRELDVKMINCTNSAGEDPLKTYKDLNGYTETIDLVFTEDYMIHANHPFDRLSYDGCFSTPKLNLIIGLLFAGVFLALGIGLYCISKVTNAQIQKRKEEKNKDRLLYS